MDLTMLKDLEGRSCVALESDRGITVKLHRFKENKGMVKGKLEIITQHGFSQNRMRLEGEPFVREWWPTGTGEIFDISTQSDQIHRNGDYIYFGMYGFGGVRLLFSEKLVNKVINKIEDGLEELIDEYI